MAENHLDNFRMRCSMFQISTLEHKNGKIVPYRFDRMVKQIFKLYTLIIRMHKGDGMK